MKMAKHILFSVMLLLVLSSCSVSNQVSVNVDISGNTETTSSGSDVTSGRSSYGSTESFSIVMADGYYKLDLARLVVSTATNEMIWGYISSGASLNSDISEDEKQDYFKTQLNIAVDSIQRLQAGDYTLKYIFEYSGNFYLASEKNEVQYVVPCKYDANLAGYFIDPMPLSDFVSYALTYQTKYSDVVNSHGLWFE